MKAAVFHALHQPLSVEVVADPTPAAGELVLRVARCGICGSDLHMTEEPAFGVPPGTVLGHEFAGEIVALGHDVESFKIGDRVAVAPLRGCGKCASCLAGETAWCSQMLLQGGGYAEYAVATPRQCLKLPATTTSEDGALVEPLAVALHGVALSGLQPGARVLVLGAGPIGLGVAFWARRLGATAVVVADISRQSSELAREVGATAFVTVREEQAAAPAPDIVFECVGRPGIIAQAIEHVRPRGTVVLLGLCTAQDSFVPFRAVSREVRLITSAFFTMREYQAALDVLDGGHVAAKALVTGTVGLSKMPEAFEALRHRTTQCKVMVCPD